MLAKIRFETHTNRETWLERIEIRDKETGKPLDLSQASINLEMAARPYNSPILKINSDTGNIRGTTDGFIEWEFSESAMRTLDAGFYKIGLVYTLNNRTTQVFLGDIQIEDGIVS